jgi:hypothetical protein
MPLTDQEQTPEPEEELIPDPRADMTPHDQVREKLLQLLGWIPIGSRPHDRE